MSDRLSDDTWQWITRVGRPMTYLPGDSLCTEGDLNTHVIFIRSGEVKAEAVNRKGDNVLFNVFGPGEVIGEMSALGLGPRAASATARTEVEAWILTADDYLGYLHDVPGAALAQLLAVSSRFREMSEHYVDRSEDLNSRVSRQLGRLASEHQTCQLTITQHELADWVGATREAVVRCLGRLRAAGAIETRRGSITIIDSRLLAGFE